MRAATKATTPTEYLASLPEPRRSELKALHLLVRRAAPGLKPYIQTGMLAYGPYPYRSCSGKEGTWCKVALASQKNYISLYICALEGGKYLAEKFKTRLPKASVGRSCVRFKKLEHVDSAVLTEMVRRAEDAAPLTKAN